MYGSLPESRLLLNHLVCFRIMALFAMPSRNAFANRNEERNLRNEQHQSKQHTNNTKIHIAYSQLKKCLRLVWCLVGAISVVRCWSAESLNTSRGFFSFLLLEWIVHFVSNGKEDAALVWPESDQLSNHFKCIKQYAFSNWMYILE